MWGIEDDNGEEGREGAVNKPEKGRPMGRVSEGKKRKDLRSKPLCPKLREGSRQKKQTEGDNAAVSEQ